MLDVLVSVSAAAFALVGAGLLARIAGPSLRRREELFAPASGAMTALIPAHDEEATIEGTIASLKKAAEGRDLRIVVGADSCTDDTGRLAAAAGAEVVSFAFRSKWRTLAALAESVRGDQWVAFVDAGALWPAGLLSDLDPLFRDPAVAGIAPAYYPHAASRVERLLWSFEAAWKKGENPSGGPVSVHGATVFYRGEALRAAHGLLAGFGRDSWLNDDVVLPFAVRLAYPGAELRYWCPPETSRRVSDAGLREEAAQLPRRLRMAAGNLEWALTLFPRALRRAPAAALVALRRLLRIFWAYWALLLLYSLCRAGFSGREVAAVAAVGTGAAGALLLVSLGRQSLVDAAAASLLAPFLVPSVLHGSARRWS